MASYSNVGTHCRIEVAAIVSGIKFLLLMGASKPERGGDVSICVDLLRMLCNKIY